jgi:hypothetical protein
VRIRSDQEKGEEGGIAIHPPSGNIASLRGRIAQIMGPMVPSSLIQSPFRTGSGVELVSSRIGGGVVDQGAVTVIATKQVRQVLLVLGRPLGEFGR